MSVFSSGTKSYLGIDMGSSSIKIVELKKQGKEVRLVNYGFTENLKEDQNKNWQNNIKDVADFINKIQEKSGTISKNSIVALPTFSVFSSVINLSNTDKKDIASTVKWEAKKIIPLPLEEMVLDWKIISEEKENKNLKILLTGAPKKLVKKYIEIFKTAKINLLSLETETFSLIRALLGNDKSSSMIVEIGSSTSDIFVVKDGIPILNRSVDIGGVNITNAISGNLNIGLERAEQFKYDLGIGSIGNNQNSIPKIIKDSIKPIVNEVKYMVDLFENKNNEKLNKIVLSGGSALLPNLPNYLANILNMNIVVGSPWSRISYPKELEPMLLELGPKLSVAVGLAMRGFN